MPMLQLEPSIPLLTPHGEGRAILVIDYSADHDLLWTCIINATGEIWTVHNKDVRQVTNITYGRK